MNKNLNLGILLVLYTLPSRIFIAIVLWIALKFSSKEQKNEIINMTSIDNLMLFILNLILSTMFYHLTFFM